MLRYSRQENFLGKEKQAELAKSSAAIVGLGSVGSAAAEYLARAGVNLKLIDRDIVEESNLNRQLYEESDIGRSKAEVLGKRLGRVNSSIKIDYFCDDFNSSTADKLSSNANIVIDGTDNFYSRFLLNDFCMKRSIPFVFASAIEGKGMVTLVIPKKTPCVSCIFQGKRTGETCETAGILPALAGIIGAVAAGEAIKFLSGSGETLSGKIFYADVMKTRMEMVAAKKRAGCPACNGVYKFLSSPPPLQRLCSDSYQISAKEIDLEKLKARLSENQDFKVHGNKELLAVIYRNKSITVFKNRIIVKNVNEEEAKTIAGRIIGM